MKSTVVFGGCLLNGTGADPIENAVVVIENDRITEIGRKNEVSIPNNANIIDAEGKTVLPGLIDAHVHLLGIVSMNPHECLITPVALRAIRSVTEGQRLIEAGFTSVRDVGSATAIFLKNAINEGTVSGPRIFAAGKVIGQTAGHGDAHDIPMRWLIEHGWFGRMADGVSECRKAAREQFRDGADFLKVMTTGGVMSEKDHPTQSQMTVEEMKAVVEEATNVNTIVATHAGGSQGIRNALEAGVKTVEHGDMLNDELIEMLLKQDVILVPTFAIGHQLHNEGAQYGVPEHNLQKLRDLSEIHLQSMQSAIEAGVIIAAGSDFLGPELCRHGENALEFELLVKAGMSPMQAIVAGTRNSALALGPRGSDLGTIEEGKLADLIVVDGDPLKDIKVLQNQERFKIIMKGGKEVIRRV